MTKSAKTLPSPLPEGGHIVDWYDVLPSKYKQKQSLGQYSTYESIKLPGIMRCAIIGASGAKKSVTLLNILLNMPAWSRVYLFCKVVDEPLYACLIEEFNDISKKVGRQIISVSTDLDEVPTIENIDPREKNLFIFDDVICDSEAKLQKIKPLYVWGRKYGKGISTIFISQSFFRIPKICRDNTDILIFLRVNQKRDLSRAISEYAFDVTEERMRAMHKHALSGGSKNFFLIDLTAQNGPGPEYTFRKNFLPI